MARGVEQLHHHVIRVSVARAVDPALIRLGQREGDQPTLYLYLVRRQADERPDARGRIQLG